ncbi:MAG: hypothetical protein ACREXR_00330 [Gammaproteobacteria bacterium]
MTTDFITVFEISLWSNGVLAGELFDLAIGTVALLGGLTGLFYVWRKRGWAWRELVWLVFVTAWAVFWLVMQDFPARFQRIDRLVAAYQAGHCEESEGIVKVLREQPAHGHSSGDRVLVDGREFEVNYFYATPAYRETIAHGGVLRSGTYVRLCHVDGAIVRVELRQDRPEQK